MKLFLLYTDDIDFVPLHLVTDPIPGYGDYYKALHTSLQPFVYNRGLSYLKEEEDVLRYGNFFHYFDSLSNGGDGENSLLCFENVLSGLYFLSDHGEDPSFHDALDGTVGFYRRYYSNHIQIGRGDGFWEFRQAYMHRLGMDENIDLQYHTCRQLVAKETEFLADSIVVIPRELEDGSRHYWWNRTKLLDAMNVPVRVVRELDYRALSMKEQVQLVAQAQVLISMVGGASYISWFLPPGATLMLLARFEYGEIRVNDAHIYDNIPYFHKRYFRPVQVYDETGEHVYDWRNIGEEVHMAMSRYDEARIAYDCN
jgi:hypothetical protein